jgi:hypothetical protein
MEWLLPVLIPVCVCRALATDPINTQSHPAGKKLRTAADVSSLSVPWHRFGIVLRKSNVSGVYRHLLKGAVL